MTVKLSPVFNDAQLDSSGNPLNGGLLFTYVQDSTTKITTYQDDGGATPHSNPIVLNSRGEPPAPIWITAGAPIKFVLAPSTDTDPPAAAIRTVNDISGVNDQASTVDEWISYSGTPTYVSSTSLTLTGDQTTVFHVGRRVKITDSGGTKYCWILTSAYASVTTLTFAGDSLASPTSAISYGIQSTTNPSTALLTDANPIVSGSADKTKKFRLEVDGFTTNTTRVLTPPDQDLTLGATTAAGDIWVATAAGVLAKLPATATVAAHATTADLFTARETVLSGSAVTFTDTADAPYAGAVAWVYMNAAHIWTQGAVFAVQGGATYTTSIGDWVRVRATTVSTFDVTIFPATPAATQAQQEAGTDLTKYVTSGRQHFHPGNAKCVAMVTVSAGTPTLQTPPSYNITSITDTATGRLTITIATDFASANWCCLPAIEYNNVASTNFAGVVIDSGSLAAGSVLLECWDINLAAGPPPTQALTDPTSWHMAGFGDQT